MSGITPYICVADSRAAIDWYHKVFDAEVSYEPIVMPDGHVGHAEVSIGDAVLMMSDEFESAGVAPPDSSRGSAVTLHLEIGDVDATVARAVDAGADLRRAPADTPHGRVAVIIDPFGHRWMLNQS